ncbi:hypothetical protein RPATATE_0818 [Rickettsia parkeri str. Tate's Hell]|uniref:Uncharacterized protein n=1 Tax=Rickettsia parkeri str. Tate's Hell TaxID=1359189 RepID=A0ABR5DRV3_RICPA|nr:hypothetical protein RPAAT24_0102 [Rickettsia parkeri str. AT\
MLKNSCNIKLATWNCMAILPIDINILTIDVRIRTLLPYASPIISAADKLPKKFSKRGAIKSLINNQLTTLPNILGNKYNNPSVYILELSIKKVLVPIQVAIRVATIVPVEKFLVPIAYSQIFFIFVIFRSPTSKLIAKKLVKIRRSIFGIELSYRDFLCK